MNIGKLTFLKVFIMTTTFALSSCVKNKPIPEGFVYLHDVDPTLSFDVRYQGHENFLGRPVEGYTSQNLVMTEAAALALKKAHDIVKKLGYRFVIYDTYRPQRAVDDFKKWMQDTQDIRNQDRYYPYLSKDKIIESGYISTRSGHSRGSTVDLTLIHNDREHGVQNYEERDLSNGERIIYVNDGTVDMGGSFDIFHEISHHDSPLATPEQLKNRDILRKAMVKAGFEDYSKEWWHYSLKDEPYPNIYFDFVVPNSESS